MIPNALASTGAYADFWSHLKSMDYALERCVDLKVLSMEQLDKERLGALAIFFRENFLANSPNNALAFDPDSFPHESASRAKFVPDFDIKQRLQEVSDLRAWHRASKMGLEKKIDKLITALEEFTDKAPKEIFKKDVPVEEFKILRAILHTILSETQSALYL